MSIWENKISEDLDDMGRTVADDCEANRVANVGNKRPTVPRAIVQVLHHLLTHAFFGLDCCKIDGHV